jgi:hypothetical protein
LGAIWVLGNTGEKYLHIPMVPWCNVQVDIKRTVTILQPQYGHRKYLVNRLPQLIKKESSYWLYSCGHHIF